jgi:glycine cleavage system H lipoate-binding protein
MTKQVYKTAQGKTVDMGKLMLQNEDVRAVGNMKVNARGDMVDDKNQIVQTKPQQVNQQTYNKQTRPPSPGAAIRLDLNG